MNKYIVCMSSSYTRDTQYIDTSDMTDKEFEDFEYNDANDLWCDMPAVDSFLGTYIAENEYKACKLAAINYGFDVRALYAIEVK